MEILTEGDLELGPEARAWIENRFEILTSRFGPIENTRLAIEGKSQLGTARWNVGAVITAFELEIRVNASADDLELAIDEVLVAAAGRLRGAKWEKLGVAARCTWCDGEEFVHVRRPKQWSAVRGVMEATHMHLVLGDDDAPRGLLEALVCRGCGHVEWFVSDPGRISTKLNAIVRTRPPDPYR